MLGLDLLTADRHSGSFGTSLIIIIDNTFPAVIKILRDKIPPLAQPDYQTIKKGLFFAPCNASSKNISSQGKFFRFFFNYNLK